MTGDRPPSLPLGVTTASAVRMRGDGPPSLPLGVTTASAETDRPPAVAACGLAGLSLAEALRRHRRPTGAPGMKDVTQPESAGGRPPGVGGVEAGPLVWAAWRPAPWWGRRGGRSPGGGGVEAGPLVWAAWRPAPWCGRRGGRPPWCGRRGGRPPGEGGVEAGPLVWAAWSRRCDRGLHGD
ncbi:unnamed protein product [Boreogadus saida]